MTQTAMDTKPKADNDLGIGLTLIGALMILLGIGSIALVLLSTYNAPEIQTAFETNTGLVLALFDQIGIILPLLIFAMALWFIWRGVRMLAGDMEAIRWAQVAMLWTSIGAIILTITTILTRSQANSELDLEFSWARGIEAAIPYAILAIPCIIASVWYFQRQDQLTRNETLASRNVRMAWNLLIPTIAVLVIVAARPLEQTFITSLTDKRFGSNQEVNFVGIENYSSLLSVRFDSVTCRREDPDDPASACRLNNEGAIRWEITPREALDEGFRPVQHIPFTGDQAILVSAKDADFVESIGNTLYFTFVSVTLELALGLFVAMVVNSKFKGRGFMRAVMLVPWAIPTVISARLWELMLRDNQSGIINKVLLDLGLIESSRAWLADAGLQLNALVMVDVWKTTPFMALLLLAGLQIIPDDLYEAGSVDGASAVQKFFNITLPLLRPTIAIALIFRTLDALRAFDVFQVLLQQQKYSMATYNYQQLIQEQDGGYASAISVVIFVLISAFTLIYVRSIRLETS